jgi:uncharacterized iron-regulated membrane protein
LNPFTGDVLRREAFANLTAGRQLRSWTRFLHTGEALGWVGQLVAGLASLGGCVLVYTGVALAWRRFFGKRASPSVEKGANVSANHPHSISFKSQAPQAQRHTTT